MKKIAMTMTFLGVLVMLVGLPPAFAEPPSNPGPVTHEYFQSGWIPFEAVCSNDIENVQITGMSFLQYDLKSVGSGGINNMGTVIIHGTAVGDGGTGYVFSEAGHLVEHFSDATVSAFQIKARLISLDQNIPDQLVIFIIRLTVDANGNVRVEVNVEEGTCWFLP